MKLNIQIAMMRLYLRFWIYGFHFIMIYTEIFNNNYLLIFTILSTINYSLLLHLITIIYSFSPLYPVIQSFKNVETLSKMGIIDSFFDLTVGIDRLYFSMSLFRIY